MPTVPPATWRTGSGGGAARYAVRMSATVIPALLSGLPAEEVVRELPMPDWLYGVLAFVVFLLVMGITWAFRNTAARAPRRRAGQTGGAHH